MAAPPLLFWPHKEGSHTMELETFDDVLASIKRNKKRPFHLLVGNGFSIAYDPKIFSYNALYNFIEDLDDADLTAVLSVIETKNFEVLMQYLDTFSALVGAFGGQPDLKKRVDTASAKLKTALLNAVKALHPEHVFTIPLQQSKACAAFLEVFLDSGGGIFSSNYDLLLYWVLMRDNGILKHVDGCGRELENPDEVEKGEEPEWSELYWGKNRKEQNVFYLHGALPFFDDGVAIVKEEYDAYNYLLHKISARMDNGEYPIFVATGDGHQKLTHIMHNRYLTYCYERLCEASGSLVTFGFRFGDQDLHIVEAINKAARRKKEERLWSVYIGAHSDEDKTRIEQIAHKFKCKVHIFDSKTAPVWG
jgi:hypothetical protein